MFIDIAIIGVSILALSFIFNIPNKLLPPINVVESVMVNGQTNYVINHPLDFLIIIIKNIYNQKTFQLTSMIGIFGLLDTYLPFVVIPFYTFFLVIMGLTENESEKHSISFRMKLAILFAISLTVFAIFAGMYILWTPVVFGEIGTKELTGVQGRYFIPLLYPALLLLANKKIKNKWLSIIRNHYQYIICVVLTISEIVILLRFWTF